LQAWQADRVSEQGEGASQRVLAHLPLADQVVDRVTRNVLNVLLAAVALVLVVACANAANLLLSRTLARSNELSLKAALGASRRRLAMQLLAQSALLVSIATALALLLARVAVGWFSALLQNNEDAAPIWMSFDFDAAMIGWTLLVALATTLFTALVPALRAGRLSLSDGLRESGRGNSGGWFNRVARTLVVIEVGLSCALLILAGMMVRATSDMAQADFGVDGSGLLTARLGLFESSHPTPAERLALFENFSRALEQTPGVESVALSTALPAMMASYTASLPADRPVSAGERLPAARYGAVDAGFVQTWRARLLQGRDFDSRDRPDSTPVAIIDRTYAERNFEGADPIGRSILLDANGEQPRSFSVIGVVDRLQLEDPGDDILPTVLVPLTQWDSRFVTVAVRTAGPPLDFGRTLVDTMATVDPDTPLYWLRDFDQVLRDAMFGERIISLLFTVFGVVALLLAGGGLYGVVAFSVAQRTRELGVRRALGAPSRRLLRNLLGRSGMEVGAGIVAGLLLGLALTRGMAAILNDFVSFHALTAGMIVLVLAAVAGVAVLLPARRALAVDPMVALRSE
jgi:predicted permease